MHGEQFTIKFKNIEKVDSKINQYSSPDCKKKWDQISSADEYKIA